MVALKKKMSEMKDGSDEHKEAEKKLLKGCLPPALVRIETQHDLVTSDEPEGSKMSRGFCALWFIHVDMTLREVIAKLRTEANTGIIILNLILTYSKP